MVTFGVCDPPALLRAATNRSSAGASAVSTTCGCDERARPMTSARTLGRSALKMTVAGLAPPSGFATRTTALLADRRCPRSLRCRPNRGRVPTAENWSRRPGVVAARFRFARANARRGPGLAMAEPGSPLFAPTTSASTASRWIRSSRCGPGGALSVGAPTGADAMVSSTLTTATRLVGFVAPCATPATRGLGSSGTTRSCCERRPPTSPDREG